MQKYIVLQGDTLYGISKQFGVSVNDIKLVNNLNSDNIVVGDILLIPKTGEFIIYVVKKGDTLYSIANRFDTSVSDLVKYNNLNNINLSIGQQLKIPVIEIDNIDNYFLYTVKVGDTLYSIAKKNNISVDLLKEYNNLSSNLLSVSQQLKIPISNKTEEEGDYLIYIVKKGDSLYSIAKKFGMSVNDLITLNNLSNNLLSIGQQLRVIAPTDTTIPIGAACYGDNYEPPVYVTYVVKRGDNLYDIARKYNVSIDSIIKLNDLSSNNLSIGQVLKIKEVL